MPVKPENKRLYPDNWKSIALQVKNQANWQCQNCDRPCRHPGQSWVEFVTKLLESGSHWHSQIEKPQRFTLTVAHLDHNPANCDPSNLAAYCSGCHLKYDARHHAANARATRHRKRQGKGQLALGVRSTGCKDRDQGI